MRRVAAGLLASALMMGAANANIISFFETRRNTDFTSAGVGGLRGTGTGTITLSGISGTVNLVYLYWHGPTNSSDPGFNATITFNGVTITGQNIGFSDDNFWGQANSQAYRADVTALVSGNGAYTIAGLFPNNSNGASLLAFYDDGDNTNNRASFSSTAMTRTSATASTRSDGTSSSTTFSIAAAMSVCSSMFRTARISAPTTTAR